MGDPVFESAAWFLVIILKFIFTPIFWIQIHEKNSLIPKKISFSKADFHKWLDSFFKQFIYRPSFNNYHLPTCENFCPFMWLLFCLLMQFNDNLCSFMSFSKNFHKILLFYFLGVVNSWLGCSRKWIMFVNLVIRRAYFGW